MIINIKSKPWWLRITTNINTSLTLAPNIYLSDTIFANQAGFFPIVDHEKLHVKQQTEMGLEKWLLKYFTDKDFLLDQECKAYALSISEYPPERRDEELAWAANALTSQTYRHAAPNADVAIAMIMRVYTGEKW